MPTMKLEIVTAERVVYSDEVEVVVAPGIEGELGILPHHAPLLTVLKPGELRVVKDGQEEIMAVSGGFLEVLGNTVTVLADTAEHAEEINEAPRPGGCAPRPRAPGRPHLGPGLGAGHQSPAARPGARQRRPPAAPAWNGRGAAEHRRPLNLTCAGPPWPGPTADPGLSESRIGTAVAPMPLPHAGGELAGRTRAGPGIGARLLVSLPPSEEPAPRALCRRTGALVV